MVGCGEKVRNKLQNQRALPLFKKLFWQSIVKTVFLIGNQKPAVKTVFGSFLDKDEHEKTRRHHILPALLAALLVRRRKNITDKMLRHVLLFAPMTLHYPNKNKDAPKLFFHGFPSSIENIWYLQCFPKNCPKMFQGIIFRSWSSLRQKKTWYSQPARKIKAGSSKCQFFLLVY